ncbi:hypothetical protein SBADM41S_06888 [Streptomyces badius]
MRMRILSIVGAAALTLGVTACSSSSDTGSTESGSLCLGSGGLTRLMGRPKPIRR